MGDLEVPGATIHYQKVGSGPLLLCISGANGSFEAWQGLAQELQNEYTVVSYDRRGFSRSYLSGSQDYDRRIETDADDAALLIRHLSSEPATVIGNSSGAMVSLVLLSRHPSVVRTLISHEPPALSVSPDRDSHYDKLQHVYSIYRKHGVEPALEQFADLVQMEGPGKQGLLAAFNARNGPFIAANTMYWFERETVIYPAHNLDLGALEAQKHKLMLVNGKETPETAIQYQGNRHLAEKLGLELVKVFGDHVAFIPFPKPFADDVLALLKKRHV